MHFVLNFNEPPPGNEVLVSLPLGGKGLMCRTIHVLHVDPVPRGGKRPLVSQSTGFQVFRAKVVAQPRPIIRLILMQCSNKPCEFGNPTPLLHGSIANPLRWALPSHFPRVRVMGNLLDRTAASGLENLIFFKSVENNFLSTDFSFRIFPFICVVLGNVIQFPPKVL